MAYFWPLTTVTENIAFVSIFTVTIAILCAIVGYLYLKYNFNKESKNLNNSVTAAATTAQPVPSEIGSGDTATDVNSISDAAMEELERETQNLQSRMKKARHRTMNEEVEKDMTADDKQREAEVKRQQLEAIFKLMEQSPSQFGISSMNEMEEQVKLYNM